MRFHRREGGAGLLAGGLGEGGGDKLAFLEEERLRGFEAAETGFGGDGVAGEVEREGGAFDGDGDGEFGGGIGGAESGLGELLLGGGDGGEEELAELGFGEGGAGAVGFVGEEGGHGHDGHAEEEHGGDDKDGGEGARVRRAAIRQARARDGPRGRGSRRGKPVR